MATLALMLCSTFVFVLLWVEKRASRGVSAAMWIPTVWMLIAASRPLATWSVGPAAVTEGNESGSPLDRWVLIGLALAAILTLVRRRSDWWHNLRQHKWLLAMLAYMFLSTFWSDITVIALKRWTRELIVLLMALVLVSEIDPRQSLASLVRRCAYVLVPFSVLLIKYYPALGRRYGKYSGTEMWIGVAGQKNELGRLCMVSVFFLLWLLYQHWRKRTAAWERFQISADLSIVFIAVYLLKGADSSTSLGTLIVGIAIFLTLCLRSSMLVPS